MSSEPTELEPNPSSPRIRRKPPKSPGLLGSDRSEGESSATPCSVSASTVRLSQSNVHSSEAHTSNIDDSRPECRLLIHYVMTGDMDSLDRTVAATVGSSRGLSVVLEAIATVARVATLPHDLNYYSTGDAVMEALNAASAKEMTIDEAERVSDLCHRIPSASVGEEGSLNATLQRQLLNTLIDVTTEAAHRSNLCLILSTLFRRAQSPEYQADPFECVAAVLERSGGARTNAVGVCIVEMLEATGRAPKDKVTAERLFLTFRRLAPQQAQKPPLCPEASPPRLPPPPPPPPSYAETSLSQRSVSSSALGQLHFSAPQPDMHRSLNFGSLQMDRASSAAALSVSSNSSTPALVTVSDLKWYERARKRTVYITKLDSALSESEFRAMIVTSMRRGESESEATTQHKDTTDEDEEVEPMRRSRSPAGFYKMRLWGGQQNGESSQPRSKFGFVEFARRRDAHVCIQRLNGNVPPLGPGKSRLKVEIARRVIDSSDPRDALFDSMKGCVRACTFGLSLPIHQVLPPSFDTTRKEELTKSSQRSHCSLILHRHERGEPTGGQALAISEKKCAGLAKSADHALLKKTPAPQTKRNLFVSSKIGGALCSDK